MIFYVNAFAGEIWGARFPALSPDGQKVSFSYYGDIWIADVAGGQAERLTANIGYDGSSCWSPDGKWIAFQTERWSSSDICIIAADGSEPPKRLTYHSSYDLPYDWTPDSKNIIFYSWRNTLRPALYEVSIKGGLPNEITDFTAFHVDMLPQGDKIYYVRGGSSWWRRHYKGGANLDIWLKTLPNGMSERITDFEGRDAYPMYSAVAQKVYFISNRDQESVNNLWRMDPDGGDPEQVTFEKEDIHFPTIAANGQIIVYQCGGDLYTYDIKNGKVNKLVIFVTEDHKENIIELVNFNRHATDFALSPEEDELAFIVHGDIFVMRIKDENPDKIVRITDTPCIEKYVSWHPDEERLIYSSMADNDMDIYTIAPHTEEKFYDDFIFDTEKIYDSDETEIKAVYSPDGNHIAYIRNKGELYVMSEKGQDNIKVCPENDVLWIDWSPDSKWLTFSRTTLGWREDIFVVRADGSERPVNISNHPNDDYKPMWSSDGRRIAFGSRDAVGNLWMKFVFLVKEDKDKTDDELTEMENDSLTNDVQVKIDFDDIEYRIREVIQVQGWYNIVAQSPDGKQFAIYANNQASRDIWTVDWLGKNLKRITKQNVAPKEFTISKDKKNIYYLSGTGNIFSADIASAQSRPLSFDVQISIDKTQEQEEVFREAWWALKDGFYDSDFHGVDWNAMFHKYKDLAVHMRTTADFHSIVFMMIGELNASHLGIYEDRQGREITGEIGIVYDPEYTGEGVKVKTVISGSPADATDVNIEPGDIIKQINGTTIRPGDNFYSMLINKANKEIMLTVEHKGKDRYVKVTPGSPYSLLQTIRDNWVKANDEYVHRKSDDKIGYLYIASMGGASLKKFETDLYKEMDKQGLIIDIRYNGGGNIHDELINILRRTAYMYSIERGGDKEYTSLFRWEKPTVVLINEFCYSDAEIFPAAFKELKLGTVIGVPTFGAVIGTNDIRLFDNSIFRIPGTGWFLLTGEDLENSPVEPDIYVENIPEEDGKSNDHQLAKAIEVLLEQIKSD
jgi:tricorn protease